MVKHRSAEGGGCSSVWVQRARRYFGTAIACAFVPTGTAGQSTADLASSMLRISSQPDPGRVEAGRSVLWFTVDGALLTKKFQLPASGHVDTMTAFTGPYVQVCLAPPGKEQPAWCAREKLVGRSFRVTDPYEVPMNTAGETLCFTLQSQYVDALEGTGVMHWGPPMDKGCVSVFRPQEPKPATGRESATATRPNQRRRP